MSPKIAKRSFFSKPLRFFFISFSIFVFFRLNFHFHFRFFRSVSYFHMVQLACHMQANIVLNHCSTSHVVGGKTFYQGFLHFFLWPDILKEFRVNCRFIWYVIFFPPKTIAHIYFGDACSVYQLFYGNCDSEYCRNAFWL